MWIRERVGRLSAFLFVLISVAPVLTQQTYKDIVALQNRALSETKRPTVAILADHAESIRIAEGLRRPRLVAVLFQRLGAALEKAGQIQRAVIAFEAGLKALAADNRINVTSEFQSLSLIGKDYDSTRSSAPADLYSESLARNLEAAEADPTLPVTLLIAIGNAYLEQPQLEPALNAYDRALKRPEIAQAPRLEAYARANMGEALRRKGDPDAAERSLTEALNLLRQYATAPESRRALTLLAGIHRDRGLGSQALTEYQQALALYKQTDDRRGEGRALAGLGRLQLDARRASEALTSFRRAVDLSTQEGDTLSLWYAYWGLGQAQRLKGDLAAAVLSLERSLELIGARQQDLRTDEGKVAFLDSVQDVFDQLIGVHMDRAASDPKAYGAALAVAERARGGALSDLMGGSLTRRGLKCDEGMRRLPAVPFSPEQSAAGVRSGAPASSAAQRAAGVSSGSQLEQMAASVPSMPDPRCRAARGTAPIDPPPLARLVFHVQADRTIVFAADTKGTVRGHVSPIGRDALMLRVRTLRDKMAVDVGGRGVTVLRGQTPAADSSADLRGLYGELIAPIEDVLPAGETVVIEPHGSLWLVPFAALLRGDGTPLIDRWPIVYSPSAQVLDDIRKEPPFQRPGDLRALIVGNPTAPSLVREDDERFRAGASGGMTFGPLQGAEAEAKTIAGVLLASQNAALTVLTGSSADLSTIEMRAGDYSLIHLGSHAVAFAGSPLESFVMLAANTGNDGRLTVRRTLNLSLAADLVTLSACQTGLGQISGDGIIGLSRAFLARGARSVMVSQWSVSDEATAALMSAFYDPYVKGSQDKAHALQSAMNKVRTRPGWEEPRYWAAFVLVGSER